MGAETAGAGVSADVLNPWLRPLAAMALMAAVVLALLAINWILTAGDGVGGDWRPWSYLKRLVLTLFGIALGLLVVAIILALRG